MPVVKNLRGLACNFGFKQLITFQKFCHYSTGVIIIIAIQFIIICNTVHFRIIIAILLVVEIAE